MSRLLLFLSPQPGGRRPGEWYTLDVVLAASPGAAWSAWSINGPTLETWDGWDLQVFAPPEPGLWVWEGELAADHGVYQTANIRRPTSSEVIGHLNGMWLWGEQGRALLFPNAARRGTGIGELPGRPLALAGAGAHLHELREDERGGDQ